MHQTIKNITLLALMLVTAVSAVVMRPKISLADEQPPINLKIMVPKAFGEWHEELNAPSQVVNPQQEAMLEATYSEILTRLYVNKVGYRIMLSIAYGKNQSTALQLHKPENCYPAQGFTLVSVERIMLNLLGTPVQSKRMSTFMGQRFEPITYWTVVGDRITYLGLPKKILEIRYAMQNRIPDGMLVRMSSIDKNTEKAWEIQQQFANAMINAISPADRTRFVGSNIFLPIKINTSLP